MASTAKRRSPRLRGNPLAGIAAVQRACDYLDGPAPLLAASLACRRPLFGGAYAEPAVEPPALDLAGVTA